MIRKSFIFLNGIKQGKENIIWNHGIRDWNDFLEAKKVKGISKAKKERCDLIINEAKRELYNENSAYFNTLPGKETYRLYDFFKEDALFLDIETNSDFGDITVVGLYDGIDTKIMVKGINMDKKLLQSELLKHKIIVTFNGSSFDLPLLSKYFGLKFGMPHIDLRHVCSRIGLSGGLKSIEKQIGIKRPKIVQEIYGGDCCLLWRMWKGSGDPHYLKLLIEYNEEDILNLKPIANFTISKLWEKVYNVNGLPAGTCF